MYNWNSLLELILRSRDREREREREMQSRATRVTVLRTVALMILKLVNPLESLEDRIAIHMNRFLRAPLVFSSSSLKQRLAQYLRFYLKHLKKVVLLHYFMSVFM